MPTRWTHPGIPQYRTSSRLLVAQVFEMAQAISESRGRRRGSPARASDDMKLTRWMHETLTLATWTPDDEEVVLRAVEVKVLQVWKPPLNLTEVTTFSQQGILGGKNDSQGGRRTRDFRTALGCRPDFFAPLLCLNH
jgi:hypothetical protein